MKRKANFLFNTREPTPTKVGCITSPTASRLPCGSQAGIKTGQKHANKPGSRLRQDQAPHNIRKEEKHNNHTRNRIGMKHTRE